jgi:hypothetical protein
MKYAAAYIRYTTAIHFLMQKEFNDMKKIILLAFIVSVSLIVTPTKSYSTVGDLLTFTETSSTDLSVTLNETTTNYGTVNNVGADHWTWTPPAPYDSVDVPNGAAWTEPENSSLVNTIESSSPSYFDIYSDIDLPGVTAVSDESFIPSGLLLHNTTTDIWMPFDAQFIDQAGDVPATVPEPSTFLLFGAGLAGVGLLRKKFKS